MSQKVKFRLWISVPHKICEPLPLQLRACLAMARFAWKSEQLSVDSLNGRSPRALKNGLVGKKMVKNL